MAYINQFKIKLAISLVNFRAHYKIVLLYLFTLFTIATATVTLTLLTDQACAAEYYNSMQHCSSADQKEDSSY